MAVGQAGLGIRLFDAFGRGFHQTGEVGRRDIVATSGVGDRAQGGEGLEGHRIAAAGVDHFLELGDGGGGLIGLGEVLRKGVAQAAVVLVGRGGDEDAGDDVSRGLDLAGLDEADGGGVADGDHVLPLGEPLARVETDHLDQEIIPGFFIAGHETAEDLAGQRGFGELVEEVHVACDRLGQLPVLAQLVGQVQHRHGDPGVRAGIRIGRSAVGYRRDIHVKLFLHQGA